MQVRNVNVGRGYELEEDFFKGLKIAVGTSRTLLSLEYITKILDSFKDKIDYLENELSELKKDEKAPPVKKVSVSKDTVDDKS